MTLLFHPRQMISNMASVFTAQEPNEELAIPQPIKTLAPFLQCNSLGLGLLELMFSFPVLSIIFQSCIAIV